MSIFNFISMRERLLRLLTSLGVEYGDISHFRAGRRHFYFINQPEYIREVLVTPARDVHKSWALQNAKRILGEGLLTSEEGFHLRQRRLAQPAFQRQRVQDYAGCMVAQAARLRERWRHGEEINAHAEMMRLTVLIAAETLFGADVESETAGVSEALGSFMNLFGLTFLPFAELLEKLPIPAMARFRKARARLDGLIYRIIEARRSDPERHQRNDLLSLLLRAEDEETGAAMSDQQLRDECVTLMLAGHETTASALTFTWYLLANNPQVEKRLHAEIDAVLSGRLPTLADVPKLLYAEMVLTESMRLYPPAWILGRQVVNTFQLGGYEIARGATLLMGQWVLQRDPRYWKNAEQFDPDRWSTETRASRSKSCYFPFGAGPRQCIGEGFAWMEGVLLLATLAQSWKLSLVPGFELELQPVITLRPKHGMPMRLWRR